MPSPFPGMDPYLEEFWGDVHAGLVLYARDELQSQLPGDLRARVEEHVFVDSPQEEERSVYPDIVVERATALDVRASAPLILELGDEPRTETFIEIIDIGSGRRVVTVLEVLSPANKRPGQGREMYQKKQRELLEGNVSLVEIDLLRAGMYSLSIPPHKIPSAYRTPYRVVVRRSWKPLQAELYAIALQQPLPAIRVPLRETDSDVTLDLQALLERAYDNGGYENDIDYEVKPDPTLKGNEATWADALLRGKGRRQRPSEPTPRRRKKRKE
jgi:Protein of unknown function (DUF4058)